LSAQHREVITVQAQDLGLILDSRSYIPLVKHHPLGDNRISQFDGCSIEQHHVNTVCLQSTRQCVGEPRLSLPPVCAVIDHHTQVIVAHRTEGALHARAKKVYQAHTFQTGQYG
jgi:hypothetical protein